MERADEKQTFDARVVFSKTQKTCQTYKLTNQPAILINICNNIFKNDVSA